MGRRVSVHPSSESPAPLALGDDVPRDAAEDARPAAGVPGAKPLPAPVVNMRGIPASNKAQRAKEAEEDRQLIAKAQAGDMASFRQLVERHQRRAFGIALALVRD